MSLASQLGSRFRTRFIAQIISVICGAILTVALARLLDPDGYGLLFLALSIFAVVKLFSRLGLAKSAARYVAEYKETDPAQVPHIIRFSFIVNILLIVIVGAVFLLTHEYIAELIGETELTPFLLIGVLFVIFGTLKTFVSRILQGFEAIEATASLLVLDKIGQVVFALGLVSLGYGALGALVGYILAAGIASVVGLVYLYSRYYNTAEQTEQESGLRRRILKYTIPVTATGTANQLDKRMDIILVGFFIGPTAVAFYTVGKQVIQFINAPVAALGYTLSPTYEAQKAKGNTEIAARIYEEALSHSLLLYIPAAAGLLLVAEPLVELVFGDNYHGAIPVLQVLSILAVFGAVTNITSEGLDFLGRAKARAVAKGITAILNVVLNIALIPTMGVIGAAVATVVTTGLYTFITLYIINIELNLRIWWLIRYTGSVLVITVVMSTAILLLVDSVTGIVSLVTIVGFGMAIWVVLAVGLGLLNIKNVLSLVS